MSKYILTYNSRIPTAIALSDRLEIPLVTSVPINATHIINWGSRKNIPHHVPYVLNRRLLSKLESFQKLKEEGISIPIFVAGPFVVRKGRHMGGRDIIRHGPTRYAVETIHKTAEFRVEVFKDKVFRIHKKIPNESTQFAWNRSNTNWVTFGYRNIREEFGDELITLAKEATQAVGYDFGALDIIQDPEGRYYVLEINSAPGLGDSGLGKYSYRIRNWINANHG